MGLDVRSMSTLQSLPAHGGPGTAHLFQNIEHVRHTLVARLRVRNYLIDYYSQLVMVHERLYAGGGDLKNGIT
jgi:hypothetical protein